MPEAGALKAEEIKLKTEGSQQAERVKENYQRPKAGMVSRVRYLKA